MDEPTKRTRSSSGKESASDVEIVMVASKKPNTDVSPIPTKEAATTKSQLELYKSALEYENDEVARRPAPADQSQFLATCGQVRSLMAEVAALKAKQGNAEEVEKRRVQIMMLMLNMRKLSRTQKVRVRVAREGALEARQSVDGVTLQLQGLLYEVLHLQKEAQRCLLAHTADKDIDLMSVKQFYQEAPKDISRPEETKNDPHQQRLARLHFELEQRRGQTSLCDQLTQDQQTVQQKITDQQTKLAALAPRINAILQSTLPLQDALQLPLAAMREQQEVAQLLPMPLYTLWMQTSAYSEAGDTMLCSIIRGDSEAAAQLRRTEQDAAIAASAPEQVAANGGADSDNDGEDANAEETRRPRGSRTTSHGASTAAPTTPAPPAVDPIKHMLALHPLHVELTVSVPDGSSVVVQFHYATQLRLITSRCLVIVKGTTVMPGAVVLTDVLSGQDFLDCLFPDDSGIVSPNPATVHQLRRYQTTHPGSTLREDEAIIPVEIGRAYRWAQLLAGLAFPHHKPGESAAQKTLLAEMAEDMSVDQPTETPSSDVSSERVHVTLSAIRRRLRARLTLQQHLLALQGANTTSGIPVSGERLQELFPGSVSSELLSWRPIAWTDYSSLPCTAAVREAGLATDRGCYFRAHYQRRHVDMVAYVCVSPDYPYTVPMFALEMKWGDQLCPFAHIQQLEGEVNIQWPELAPTAAERSQVLPRMLYRLAMCLDVYTETLSSRLSDTGLTVPEAHHFSKEKIIFRTSRGPDRAFPLRYLAKLRVFAQR